MKSESSQETRLGQEWADPEIFNIYEGGRALFRDASKRVVESVFKKYVSSDGVTVELGSGIGELSKLVPPEYSEKLIEIEKNGRFSQIRKARDAKAKTVVADIYKLPLQDESVDTVASFSVFDTLPNLEKAMAEAKRVLKNGGKFIHLLDLQPNMHILMRELPPDVVPFPNIVNNEITGFQLVRREDYQKMRARIDSRKLPIFDLYAKDPIFYSGLFHQNAQDILADMADTVQQWDGIEKSVTPTLQEGFEQKMLEALKKNGLKVSSVGNISAEAVVLRNEAHKKTPEKNYFENRVGAVFTKYLPELEAELPKGHVKEKSTLHVVIAEKTAE